MLYLSKNSVEFFQFCQMLDDHAAVIHILWCWPQDASQTPSGWQFFTIWDPYQFTPSPFQGLYVFSASKKAIRQTNRGQWNLDRINFHYCWWKNPGEPLEMVVNVALFSICFTCLNWLTGFLSVGNMLTSTQPSQFLGLRSFRTEISQTNPKSTPLVYVTQLWANQQKSNYAPEAKYIPSRKQTSSLSLKICPEISSNNLCNLELDTFSLWPVNLPPR